MQNLLDPAILFFVFGVLAGLLKSNLEIPPAISRFLSLYLLMALGLKGGFALARSGLNAEVATTLGCAVALAVIVPLLGYQIMRRFLSGYDAAAIAATYGSVSAVTFITTLQYLESRGLPYGGHMAAAMALMESPAIILAVLLANRLRQRTAVALTGVVQAGAGVLALGGAPAPNPVSLGQLLHEAFTDGAQLLLLGAMLVGVLTGAEGEAMMAPFSVDLFKGMLAFFLLDMGLTAARQLAQLGRPSPLLLLYAVAGPLLHASLALGLALAFGIEPGSGALLMVLAASASYIAVPAALRYAIPEARPALYLGLSLGVTFPFNLLLGIPLYVTLAWRLLA
ncbi:sodium-dependent bicarbonate transport family permease [Malikia spinosa]|uniref:Sodium-dependent bicarbonate transport family permease n=1 Tax=Malikia spinosa TaxID=86180 RepID=A0A7C9MT27_9BURK|nr:sodium-dependent bicarbonate transport family permease [Malikia spinosa]MYZ53418.1 sodium-dependent bicarbonate transport family permease [Malikia spinosa]